jgi:hypothetical protein
MSVVYDTGVLIAADRNDRTVWADHRIRLEIGVLPRTTAPVVAQVSRSAPQAQLSGFLRGCEIVAFSPGQVHEVGALMGRAGTSDVVDAHLVVTAAMVGAPLVTSHPDDLLRLSNHLPAPIAIRRI